jgi:hypothetical protein
MVAYQVNGSLTERNLAAARWRKLVKEMPGRRLTQPGYARADGILNGHIAGPDPESRAVGDQSGAKSNRLSPESNQLSPESNQLSPESNRPGPANPGPANPGRTEPGRTEPRGATHLSRPEPLSPTEAFHPLDTFLLEHPGDEGRPPHGIS